MIKRKRNKCIFKVKTQSILEAIILAMLLEKSSHGYVLMNRILEYGINAEIVGQGVMYRILNRLEDMGYIEAEWDTNSVGPAKKVYSITSKGKNFLVVFVEKERKKILAINSILDKINDKIIKDNN